MYKHKTKPINEKRQRKWLASDQALTLDVVVNIISKFACNSNKAKP